MVKNWRKKKMFLTNRIVPFLVWEVCVDGQQYQTKKNINFTKTPTRSNCQSLDGRKQFAETLFPFGRKVIYVFFSNQKVVFSKQTSLTKYFWSQNSSLPRKRTKNASWTNQRGNEPKSSKLLFWKRAKKTKWSFVFLTDIPNFVFKVQPYFQAVGQILLSSLSWEQMPDEVKQEAQNAIFVLNQQNTSASI